MVDKKNICTIVVTYGERFYLVKEVVNACLKSDLENFIIVDNGSPAKNAELLQNFAEMTKKATIKIIRLDQNYGSAGGYSKGIKTALNDSNNEYLFLLDDDNKIDLNTVNNLCSYWVEKATVGFKDKTALLALRSDRPYYREYISNPEPEKLIGSTNSFMHYDIFHTKFKKGLVLNHADKMEIRSPIAPYGGLFFHRDLISNIGLPEEKFFLYIDDIEFTYRITKSGGAIYIVPKTNIIDIDESWGNKKTDKHFISSTVLDEIEGFRIFYTFRNRVYFEYNKRVDNKPCYFINMFIVLTKLFIKSVLKNKFKRYRLIVKAVKDGLQGKLGIANGNP